MSFSYSLRYGMKHFFQSLVSWWFAVMTPVRILTTTLAERENMRKRKLLSVVLGVSFFSTLAYLASGFALSLTQTLLCCVSLTVFLCALWVNRQGYLKIASLTFFFISGFTTLTGVHTVSSSNPFLLLWACFLMTVFVAILGLFLPPWLLFLAAVIENLILFWYLLVVCHAQITHLLSHLELQCFLVYLGMLIYESTLVGIFYAITTK